MKQTMIAAILTARALAAGAAPQPPPQSLTPPPRPVLTDEMIRKAVRETIAEDPRPVAAESRGAAVYGAVTPHGRMGAAFEQARVPDCLHDDALKHQPATIGPINVVGMYSLPWVVAAVVRGKCN
jgi:hypothetical protein